MNLFQHGTFKSAAGLQLAWKIECDALTDEDWRTLACVVAPLLPRYCKAVGVPTGGERFAEFLNLFADAEADAILIADDVLTTGSSIQDMYKKCRGENKKIIGVVLFSRMERFEVPAWITPVFQLATFR